MKNFVFDLQRFSVGINGSLPISVRSAATADIPYEHVNTNLTLYGNTIGGVVSGDTIYSTGGATNVLVQAPGVYRFGTGEYFNFMAHNDSIMFAVKNSSIVTAIDVLGQGDVSIFSEGSNISINGGAGNDEIRNILNNVSINAGAGDDEIYNAWGTSVTINGGDGDDEISNLGENDQNVSINGGAGNDTISNGGSFVTIDAGAGDDYFNNDGGDSIKIDGGLGNDTISNWGYFATLDGGAGDDYIEQGYSNASIDGGDGNDTIDTWGNDHVTLAGGKGDDLITVGGSNNLIKYSAGDGNDTIQGFRADSTLQIGNGTGTYSTQVSGSDIIVTVGEGKITLVGAASLLNPNIAGTLGNPLSIVGTEGDDSIDNTLSGATIQALGGNDTITNCGEKTFIKSTTGNNYIKNTYTNRQDYSYSYTDEDGNIVGVGVSFTDRWIRSNYSTIETGTGNDTIFNNLGTGTSIVSDGGNNSILSIAYDATVQTGSGKDSIRVTGDKVSVCSGAGKDYIDNYDTGYYYLCGQAIWLCSGGNDSTLNAGAGNDTISNAGDNVLIFGGSGNDYISNRYYVNEEGYIVLDASRMSSGANVTIDAGTGNDTIANGGEGVLIKYTSGDGNDLIVGFNSDDTLQIDGGTYSTQKSGDDVIVRVGKGSILLKGAASLETLNIGSKASTRLTLTDNDDAKQTLPAQIVTADATARTSSIRIVGNELDNSILGGSKNDTLYGKDGNDYLAGGAGHDKLYGQNGADTLCGGAGNDTLTGGKGNDLFLYEAGNDVITDYAAGDKISLGAAVSKATLKGSDAVLTVGSGTLTIKNVGFNELTLLDAEGSELTTIIGGTAYDNEDDPKQTLASGVVIGDATARTKGIRISGNTLANTILGGAGKDTLYGKGGDDYLEGNGGSDKLYGQAATTRSGAAQAMTRSQAATVPTPSSTTAAKAKTLSRTSATMTSCKSPGLSRRLMTRRQRQSRSKSARPPMP